MDNSKEMRDAFVAAALVGIIAAGHPIAASTIEDIAAKAFTMSEAMLAESKRRAD